MTPSIATRPPVTTSLREIFDIGVAKTRNNIRELNQSGATWAFATDGDFSKLDEGFFDISNWTTSFFTGMTAMHAVDGGQDLAGRTATKPGLSGGCPA